MNYNKFNTRQITSVKKFKITKMKEKLLESNDLDIYLNKVYQT